MSAKKVKRARKASKLVQVAFRREGTAARVHAAHKALKHPFVSRSIAAYVRKNAWTTERVTREARLLLAGRGLDLRGVQITAEVAGVTITLRADAAPEAIESAHRLADRLATLH